MNQGYIDGVWYVFPTTPATSINWGSFPSSGFMKFNNGSTPTADTNTYLTGTKVDYLLNPDGAFTLSQSVAQVSISLNTGHANTWSGKQTFQSVGGVTQIVSNVSLTGQVADINATTLTSTVGLYRVSYSLQDTTSDITAGAVVLTLAYTDGAGSTTATATQVLTGTGRQNGSVYIQLASGNLTYAITHTGLFGTATYALNISTERLL